MHTGDYPIAVPEAQIVLPVSMEPPVYRVPFQLDADPVPTYVPTMGPIVDSSPVVAMPVPALPSPQRDEGIEKD